VALKSGVVVNWRSDRIEWKDCSSNARSSFSGAMEGRPIGDYIAANSGERYRRTSLTIPAIRRSG